MGENEIEITISHHYSLEGDRERYKQHVYNKKHQNKE